MNAHSWLNPSRILVRNRSSALWACWIGFLYISSLLSPYSASGLTFSNIDPKGYSITLNIDGPGIKEGPNGKLMVMARGQPVSLTLTSSIQKWEPDCENPADFDRIFYLHPFECSFTGPYNGNTALGNQHVAGLGGSITLVTNEFPVGAGASLNGILWYWCAEYLGENTLITSSFGIYDCPYFATNEPSVLSVGVAFSNEYACSNGTVSTNLTKPDWATVGIDASGKRITISGTPPSESSWEFGFRLGNEAGEVEDTLVLNSALSVLRVVDQHPLDQAKNTDPDHGAGIVFSEPILGTTVDETTCWIEAVKKHPGETVTRWDGIFHGGNSIGFMTPSENGRKYRVTVRGGLSGVRGVSGACLDADHIFEFTTCPALNVEVIPVQLVDNAPWLDGRGGLVRVKARWGDPTDVDKLEAEVSLKANDGDVGAATHTFYHSDYDMTQGAGTALEQGNSANLAFMPSGPGVTALEATVVPVNSDTEFKGSASLRSYPSRRAGGVFRFALVPVSVAGYTNADPDELLARLVSIGNTLPELLPIGRLELVPSANLKVSDPSSYWLSGDWFRRGISANMAELEAWNKKYGDADLVIELLPSAYMVDVHGSAGLSRLEISGHSIVVEDLGVTKELPWIVAHEYGHAVGLEHPSDDSPPTLTRHAGIGGWYESALRSSNPEYTGNLRKKVYAGHCIMFKYIDTIISGSANFWWDTTDYEAVVSRLLTPVYSPAPIGAVKNSRMSYRADPKSSDLAYLHVGGMILSTGGVESVFIEDLFEYTGSQLEGDSNSSYAAVLQDAGGVEVGRAPFTPALSDSLGPDTLSSFSVDIPWVPQAQRLRILNGSTILHAVARSDHAPEGALASPVAGATYSNEIPVAWSATDADGDSLSFEIAFSQNNGESWSPVARDWTNATYAVDASIFPGSTNCRIQVTAFDGFNSFKMVSDVFRLRHPPAVTATVPAAGDKHVSADANLWAQFAGAMNPATINADSFRVWDHTGARLAGTVSYDSRLQAAIFDPDLPMATGQAIPHTARITTGVRDVFGDTLPVDFTWSFWPSVLTPGFVANYQLPAGKDGDNDDADNDGMSNKDELLSGTNPMDENSYLYVEAPSKDGDGRVVKWPGVEGYSYHLYSATNLAGQAPFVLVAPYIQGVVPITCYTDTTVNAACPVFYRIGCE